MVGDFNLPFINWESNTTDNTAHGRLHQAVFENLSEMNLTQVQRITNPGLHRILYLTMINSPELITETSTATDYIQEEDRHHVPLQYDLNLTSLKTSSEDLITKNVIDLEQLNVEFSNTITNADNVNNVSRLRG